MTKNIDIFHDMHFILDVPVFVTTSFCLFTQSPLDGAVSMMAMSRAGLSVSSAPFSNRVTATGRPFIGEGRKSVEDADA